MRRPFPHLFSIIALVVGVMLTIAVSTAATAGDFSLKQVEDGIEVRIGGKLFTKYVTQSGPKPILYPLIGPTGKPMTRNYPITKEKLPTERQDHVHHRSFWFTHGKVNGVNFWSETEGHGEQVQKKVVKAEASGNRATIITQNDWLGPDGKKVCEDVRTLTFGANGKHRWIDFDITIKASEGDLTFGDDKEGTFGVRVAGTMKVDAKLGGQIINSNGQTDKQAWGKRAAWVDYHGPVDGETVGVAILNHPGSFRFPTHWHVRTYGLFTANPFGWSFFEGKNKDGAHTIAAGESMTLNYRVLLHAGDEKVGEVAKEFEAYSQLDKE